MIPFPRAIIFDWDNTLVDSWPIIHDALNTTLDAMGHQRWSVAEMRERVGRSLRDAFPELFGERWKEARDTFYAAFRAIHLDRLKPLPGVAELLPSLVDRGIILAIVSNKTGDHLRREASHLDWRHFFVNIVGATDAARDKPAPEPVAMALAGSGIGAGAHVWFVGDSYLDMECAHATGCTPILVGRQVGDEAFLRRFPPSHHLDACTGLAALLSKVSEQDDQGVR